MNNRNTLVDVSKDEERDQKLDDLDNRILEIMEEIEPHRVEFVRLMVVEGMGIAEAYLQAYGTRTKVSDKKSNISACAASALRRPVILKLRRLMRERLLHACNLDAQQIVKMQMQLIYEAQKRKNLSVVQKGIEYLGKLHGVTDQIQSPTSNATVTINLGGSASPRADVVYDQPKNQQKAAIAREAAIAAAQEAEKQKDYFSDGSYDDLI